MSLAFVLLDFQHAGVRRRAWCHVGVVVTLKTKTKTAKAVVILKTKTKTAKAVVTLKTKTKTTKTVVTLRCVSACVCVYVVCCV